MQYFFTQFAATRQRTAAWIERYLADDARLLFLIKTDAGRWEGHLGVCHIAGDVAELDNTIRGERRGHPKLFYLAELAVVRWAMADLGVDSVYLRLFADNARAIALHDKIGFRAELMQRLIARPYGDDVHFEIDAAIPPGPQDASLLQLRIDRAAFFGRHPWLAGGAGARPGRLEADELRASGIARRHRRQVGGTGGNEDTGTAGGWPLFSLFSLFAPVSLQEQVVLGDVAPDGVAGSAQGVASRAAPGANSNGTNPLAQKPDDTLLRRQG